MSNKQTELEQGLKLLRAYVLQKRADPKTPSGDLAQLETAQSLLERCTVRDINRIGDYFQDGMVIFDPQGNIVYVNQANEVMFGIPWDECVGHNASEFAGEGAWIDNATTLQVFGKKKAYTSIAVPKRTGRQLLQTGVPIFDADGVFEGVVVIDKDISEIMQIKEALDTTRSQLALTEEINAIQEQMIHVLSSKSRNNGNYVYESPRMRETVEQALQIAKSDATTLITGETGCGKEVLADIIQSHSARSDKPYIKVNCAAIPETLIESELFGYEKGAFTGASPGGKAGMFELANTGTLLLDEIGEIPLPFQTKLLRALQNKQIMRVGGTKPISLDVRLIASTNRNLKEMARGSAFREDLYYRLSVLPLQVPPLRERPEDIEVLTRHFLAQFNKKYGKGICLEPLVYSRMKQYAWPGNIRELENVIERWVVIFEPYAVLQWKHVKGSFTERGELQADAAKPLYSMRSMAEIMADYQRDVLTWAAGEYKSVREMAAALQVDHSTIVKMAKRLGLTLHKPQGEDT